MTRVKDQQFVPFSPKLATDSKWLQLSIEREDAARPYVDSIIFCWQQNNDGVFSRMQALMSIRASQEQIDYLVKVELWDIVDEDHYSVHGYLNHQFSREERREQHERDVRNGKKGGRPPKQNPQVNEKKPMGFENETHGKAGGSDNKNPSPRFGNQSKSKSKSIDTPYSPPQTGGGGNTARDDAGSEPVGKEESSRSDERLDECFNAFWENYPNHSLEANARRAFARYLRSHPKTEPETIIEGSRKLAEWVRDGKKEAKYVPQAAKWLRGEGWNDEEPRVSEKETRENRLQETLRGMGFTDHYITPEGRLKARHGTDTPYVTSSQARELYPFGYRDSSTPGRGHHE
jgi:hypothetical protein